MVIYGKEAPTLTLKKQKDNSENSNFEDSIIFNYWIL